MQTAPFSTFVRGAFHCRDDENLPFVRVAQAAREALDLLETCQLEQPLQGLGRVQIETFSPARIDLSGSTVDEGLFVRKHGSRRVE